MDELFTATAPASLQASGCRFVPTHRVPAGPSSETRAGSPTTAEFRDAMSELRVYASRRRHRYANHTARLFCSHPQQRTRYHASCLLSSHACTHEGGTKTTVHSNPPFPFLPPNATAPAELKFGQALIVAAGASVVESSKCSAQSRR